MKLSPSFTDTVSDAKQHGHGAEEMGQQLRALAVLAEDRRLVTGTHV